MAIAPPPPLVTITPLRPAAAATEFEQRPRLIFAEQDLQPPTQFWVTPDDTLTVGIRNSLTGVQVQIDARMWRIDGESSNPNFRVSPPADRVLRYTSQPLFYGYLTSVVAFATGATLPRRGHTYVSLQVSRTPAQSFTQVLTMGAGYLAGSNFVQWPYSRISDATDGAGLLRAITGTTPAAGAEITETVPTNGRWRLRSLRLSLTTSAAVATRQVAVGFQSGANLFLKIPGIAAQTASQSVVQNFFAGDPTIGFAQTDQYFPLPPDLVIDTGFTLITQTANLQAGDQWSPPLYEVEEWMED